jgi:hypothetical protein
MIELTSSRSVPGRTQDHVLGHHFRHGAARRVPVFADHPSQHVALGKDAGDLAVVHDQQRADLVLVHLVDGIDHPGGPG